MDATEQQYPPVPADDPTRTLKVAGRASEDTLPHIGLVGDTYTITVSGRDTAGRYCVVDMHVPPGGGPPPHRHDFEETFVVLEGEVQAIFRGQTMGVRQGETIYIPASAPHAFRNASDSVARLLCICSPAGQEEFFEQVGVRVATRTTPPPALSEDEAAAFGKKVEELAPKYKTEMLPRV